MSDALWLASLPSAAPLRPHVRRFLALAGAQERDIPSGLEGLRWLCAAIDRVADSEQGDALEATDGAGALFACLLLHHFGGAYESREGLHRVRLGVRGYFDPFGAAPAAFDADTARSVLVPAVARAEDECHERVGVGRIARLFERELAARRPDLDVSDRFDMRLWLGPEVEVDLQRVVQSTEGESESAALQAVAKLIAMLPGGEAAQLDPSELRARMLPRLVPEGFAPEGVDGLALLPYEEGVHIALVMAYEGRSRFLRRHELAAAGFRTADEALSSALDNLAARSHSARFARIDTPEGPFVCARTGDGLDAARLLLPGLHAVLAAELGSPFFAATPHRDLLLACRALGD